MFFNPPIFYITNKCAHFYFLAPIFIVTCAYIFLKMTNNAHFSQIAPVFHGRIVKEIEENYQVYFK